MTRVLIIDDDPSGTQLLITLLGFEGYEGLNPENWQNLMEDVERLRPDLVMMDVHLQSLDGILLLRELRAHPEPDVSSIPVLIMSAEDHRERSISAGANDFIDKPFDHVKLFDTIENILKGGSLDD
jgi:DNA-binding response OmpR family regulator